MFSVLSKSIRNPTSAGWSRSMVWLGLDTNAQGLISWDVFDAVLTPGGVILLVSWRDQAAAEAFADTVSLQAGARLRRVRVVRDYGMFDRREAPQYYPDVTNDYPDVTNADTVRV
jgi:hypothetical protein